MKKFIAFLNKQAFLCPLLLAIFFVLFAYGPRILNPYDYEWLLQRDTTGQYLGWAYFKISDWQFPITQLSFLMHPFGTTVVSTDSIPLLAILSKIFFSSTGEGFHYFGFWVLLCYMLQAVFAFKIFRLFKQGLLVSNLAACFFILSPPLLFRADHKALCAHWLILAMLFVYYRFSLSDKKQIPYFAMLGLNALAIMIHPYLLPMCFCLCLPNYWLYWVNSKKNRRACLKIFIQLSSFVACTAFITYCLGYFLVQTPAGMGFGLFSADLLTFFNSQSRSDLIPKIRFGSSQHEGFGYLGLSGALLFFHMIFVLSKFGKKSLAEQFSEIKFRPILVICLLLFFYALSSHITFGGNPILRIEWFYNLFGNLSSIFRSSGRFIWPLYYLLWVSILMIAIRYIPRRFMVGSLLALIALQIIDMRSWYLNREMRAPSSSKITQAFNSPRWQNISSEIVKLELAPPFIASDGFQCSPGGFHLHEYSKLALIAAHGAKEINSGHFARIADSQSHAICDQFWHAVDTGIVHEKSLYIVNQNEPYYSRFMKGLKEKLKCERIDGFDVCYAKEHKQAI